MGLISGCRYLKVNLKAKMYICVNSTIQRCPNKIINIFLIEDFSHLPPVSTTSVVNLQLRISPQNLKKFETVLMGHSGAGGKLIDEKNQKQKISWHCPFKVSAAWYCSHYLPPVSLTPVANLPPVSTRPAELVAKFTSGMKVAPRIFEKIRNGPNGILRGLGETDSWKKIEVENLVALSL